MWNHSLKSAFPWEKLDGVRGPVVYLDTDFGFLTKIVLEVKFWILRTSHVILPNKKNVSFPRKDQMIYIVIQYNII